MLATGVTAVLGECPKGRLLIVIDVAYGDRDAGEGSAWGKALPDVVVIVTRTRSGEIDVVGSVAKLPLPRTAMLNLPQPRLGFVGALQDAHGKVLLRAEAAAGAKREGSLGALVRREALRQLMTVYSKIVDANIRKRVSDPLGFPEPGIVGAGNLVVVPHWYRTLSAETSFRSDTGSEEVEIVENDEMTSDCHLGFLVVELDIECLGPELWVLAFRVRNVSEALVDVAADKGLGTLLAVASLTAKLEFDEWERRVLEEW